MGAQDRSARLHELQKDLFDVRNNEHGANVSDRNNITGVPGRYQSIGGWKGNQSAPQRRGRQPPHHWPRRTRGPPEQRTAELLPRVRDAASDDAQRKLTLSNVNAKQSKMPERRCKGKESIARLHQLRDQLPHKSNLVLLLRQLRTHRRRHVAATIALGSLAWKSTAARRCPQCSAAQAGGRWRAGR